MFVNNSWCTKSKEVSRFWSSEAEYLMISCRPHYLPREFSSIFFVSVYLQPQTDAGTKTTLNELSMAISKQKNAHPETALLVAGDFNAGKLTSVLPNFYQHVKCATRGEKKNSRPPLLHTQRRVQSSPSPSIWQFWPPDSCLQAKTKAGSTSASVKKVVRWSRWSTTGLFC